MIEVAIPNPPRGNLTTLDPLRRDMSRGRLNSKIRDSSRCRVAGVMVQSRRLLTFVERLIFRGSLSTARTIFPNTLLLIYSNNSGRVKVRMYVDSVGAAQISLLNVRVASR